MCYVFCVLVAFPCGVLGQVCFLMVSIPDLCLLSYFAVDVITHVVVCFINQIKSENDQEMPESHTADQPTVRKSQKYLQSHDIKRQ